jgi:solute carrier family 9 (sodium/hydrogen exchanger), member 6/7
VRDPVVSFRAYEHCHVHYFERTLSQFHGTEIYLSSLFHGTGIFLLSFSVSMVLGVAFGLAMSLVLKHSSLAVYPSIESCLVALCAYTCYFFSNGLSMSGIVSLLFCGITLKHYAYHTMSLRTQRATKYIFGTLAKLSENFIFIYLGMSLFTSPPSGEKVTSYVKPLFIAITTVAVVFTRYAAVFPLSELINFFQRHARGQRSEELPHAYQMMLFWAGLRGAVGVALAAGFKGNNALTLRTTVLVVVVLTVVLFGGTTSRMLEILGIRTGVDDDDASSSDDEEPLPPPLTPGRRHARWQRLPSDYQAHDRAAAAARIGSHYAMSPRSYNHHVQNLSRNAHHRATQSQQPFSPVHSGSVFSAASSDSYDSDGGEVLPLASTSSGAHRRSASAGVSGATELGPDGSSPSAVGAAGEDGKWFQAIDERYLLPLFSNATASRTFYAKRTRRAPGTEVEPGEEEEEEGPELDLGGRSPSSSYIQGLGIGIGVGESRVERGLSSPILRRESDPALSKLP